MPSDIQHLEVIAGPDKGKRFQVPQDGAGLGRADENRIVLSDPLLSRNHCRFEFQPGEGLRIKDLDSANETLVNDRAVKAVALKPGDRITVGDTVLRVLRVQPAGAAPAGAASATDTASAAPPPIVDLGFEDTQPVADRGAGRLPPRFWWILGGSIGLLLALALFFRLTASREGADSGPVRAVDDPRAAATFDLRYEKIDAHTNNVFRYALRLTPENMLSVRIDDLAQSRHVRQEQAVEPALVQELIEAIRRSGFFGLEPRYEGLGNPNEKVSWDIEIILGRRVYRTVVRNRSEPAAFRDVRERIETFSKNELGIWALQYPRERLIEMAHDALLLGRKLFAERDVSLGNLAEAIQRFREAEFYLETIDPRPDFYPGIVAELREAADALDARYAEHRFRADRALNLQDWETAARELRILMELIPDRRDERHQEAQRKLLDVESRQRLRRRS